MLSKLLRSVNFISQIEEDEVDETLDTELKKMLDKRIFEYEKNPEKFISHKELRKRISKKHGL